MPRRKKLPEIPDYTGKGRNAENHIVQKSTPLLSLSESNLTLPELKILDAYLSRINSHTPEKRFIRLEKGKIEELLGVTQIKSSDLEKRIDNLFQPVTIRDESKDRGFAKIALFEKAACYQDNDGLWQVDLGASMSAMEYIFNPENLGYLRYRLANVIHLTSRYSYVLYLYLERERYRKTWEVPLDVLKGILQCTADTYSAFKRFNDLVLKKCHKELVEKTNLRYVYESVKKGRKVVAVRFTLETLADQLEGQLSFESFENHQSPIEDHANQYSSEQLAFLAEACEYEFPDKEMRVLLDLLLQFIPYDIQNGLERFHYLRQKYDLLQLYAAKKKIANRFQYLKTSIERDIMEEPSKSQPL